MIMDKENTFSEDQAIVATAASTNSIDLGAMAKTGYRGLAQKRNLDKSQKVPLLIQVTQAFNTLTSLTVSVETDDNAGFSSPKTVATFTVPLAELVMGYNVPIEKLPRGILERYLQLKYTVVGTAPTLGKITAGIVGATDGAYMG